MRADIHDGPEHMLQSEAGYIDARPLTPARQNLLQRTAGPYKWVKLRRTQYEHMFSALPSNSDIARRIRHVSKGPQELTLVPLRRQICDSSLRLAPVGGGFRDASCAARFDLLSDPRSDAVANDLKHCAAV